jgi:hypothetical protein
MYGFKEENYFQWKNTILRLKHGYTFLKTIQEITRRKYWPISTIPLMNKLKVLVLGGSGFVGQELSYSVADLTNPQEYTNEVEI